MKRPLWFALVVFSLAALPTTTLAAVPDFVTYSGRLTDGTGWGQSDSVALTFRIYAQAEGGASLWEQAFPAAPVEDGYFSVILSGVVEVFGAHDQTWVTVCVGEGCTPEEDVMPRQAVGSVPYAMRAGHTPMSGKTRNLGLKVEDGNLIICAADGSELGDANFGWVRIGSKVQPGRTIELAVTENAILDPVAHLTNVTFGIDGSADWLQNVPFFIWAISSNGQPGSLRFAVSRKFAGWRSSLADEMGSYSSPVPQTDNQQATFVLSDLAPEAYAEAPIVLVGTFRMKWKATDGHWSVSTPLTYSDGIGEGALDAAFATIWTMPTGQNGAYPGKYFIQGTFVAPVWEESIVKYRLARNGGVRIFGSFKGGNPGGQGYENMQFPLPYSEPVMADLSQWAGVGYARHNGASHTIMGVANSIGYMMFTTAGAFSGWLQFLHFAQDGDLLSFTMDYSAY